MKNYLISEAIGDITGSAYEGRAHRIKDYDKVKMFSSRAHFTDDTVLTFACAEAFIDHLDMTMNLWKCANEHRHSNSGWPLIIPTHIAAWVMVLPCAAHLQDGWQRQKRNAFAWPMKQQHPPIIIQKGSRGQKLQHLPYFT